MCNEIKENDCQANEIECANRSAPWTGNFRKSEISGKVDDPGRFLALNRPGVLAGANFIALRRTRYNVTLLVERYASRVIPSPG